MHGMSDHAQLDVNNMSRSREMLTWLGLTCACKIRILLAGATEEIPDGIV